MSDKFTERARELFPHARSDVQEKIARALEQIYEEGKRDGRAEVFKEQKS